MFCQICWRTCRVLPLFSLFFLGIGIFRTSIGMCLWWLACSAEFLPSIFPKAAFSLAGPAEVSLAEHTSLTPSSSRLTLAPGSAATDALLGRFASCPFGPKLSSIVVYSDKLSPVSPTATLLDCLSASHWWHRCYLWSTQGCESNATRAMLLQWRFVRALIFFIQM